MDFIANLLGDWACGFNTYSCILKICLCLFIGLVIGSERARNLQAAGLKTFMFVSISSVMAGLLDFYLLTEHLVAFSFVCPIVILSTAIISSNTILFNSKNQFRGLTTSVGLICAGTMGMIIAHGFYFIGIAGLCVYVVGSFVLPKLEAKVKGTSLSLEVYVELKSRESLQSFMQTLRQLGLKINGVELNPAYANSGLAVYSVALKIIRNKIGKVSHKEIVEAISALDIVNHIEEIL